MKILVINAGSSSLKYQLIDMQTKELIAKGLCEKIGGDSKLIHKANNKEITFVNKMKNHKEAMEGVLNTLTSSEYGVIKSIESIDGFGHRYVHGGPKYFDPVIATVDIIADLKKNVDYAPLHCPAHIAGIEACMKVAPNIPNIIVFDPGFHKTMPEKAHMYALPYTLCKEYGIRKYGFHGTSHYYIMKETSIFLGKKPEELKIVSCHVGNGASICAIDQGKCVDTSMGFTPLEGLMMGTRCGDIDPAVVQYMMKKFNLSIDDVLDVFNKKSGLYGISEISNDYRDVYAEVKNNPKCALALEMLAYRVVKYIGSYIAAMNGVDAIVFTAGTGENRADFRKNVMDYFGYIGAKLDDELNNNAPHGEDFRISSKTSKVEILIIPTDEEMVIAEETVKMLKKI